MVTSMRSSRLQATATAVQKCKSSIQTATVHTPTVRQSASAAGEVPGGASLRCQHCPSCALSTELDLQPDEPSGLDHRAATYVWKPLAICTSLLHFQQVQQVPQHTGGPSEIAPLV